MLTPCKSLENPQDDLSADDDILENTKPNLISFSLSTSSSNHTVSGTANSGRCDAAVECHPGRASESRHLEHLRGSDEINSPGFDTPLMSPVAEMPASPPSSCRVSSANSQLFTEKAITRRSKSDIFKENTSGKYSCAIPLQSDRPSSSMCNLYDVNSLRNDMPRFASHPLLNSQQESKRSLLTRSLSSVSLKHRSHAYDHVESKVKHYIEQLKRAKVQTNEQSKEVIVNFPHPREDLDVTQLQLEVERLQNYLEERDLLLHEVQSNYHSLLLQYGEAKNKLDQLRFTSLTPQQAAKSVQTQSPLIKNETTLVGHSENDQLIVFKKIGHESEDRISSSNDSSVNMIEDKKEQKEDSQIYQNTKLSDNDHCKIDFEAKESNESSVEKNSLYSPDMAALKVSAWFSSLPWQPLPVPSCYGSLGSSGSISHQPLDGSVPTNTCDGNGDRKLAEPREHLWAKNCNLRCKPYGDCDATVAEEGNSCFPPMQKCYCWGPNNIQNRRVLEGKPYVESVKSEMEDSSRDVLCVPPLDLEHLNNSTIPHDSSVSKNLFLSEDSLSYVCSQHSSFEEKGSFKQTKVVDQMYLETPTSYKSIVINPARTDAKSSGLFSLCTNQQNCGGKNDLCLRSTSIQSNCSEDNWKKINDQRPCCLKKILQRCCVNDVHICCHWSKTSNHQLWRCDQCVPKNSVVPSDSQMLLNLEQFLGNMTVCAEGLRKRSEAIQSFLTNLLDGNL